MNVRWWVDCPDHGHRAVPSASCHECAMLQPDPSVPQPVNQFHDDWLLWTIYSDGSVRQAMTECWPEHGVRGNWPAVMRAAAKDPKFAGRLLRFALEVPEILEVEFTKLLNAWRETLAPDDFGFARERSGRGGGYPCGEGQ